MRSCKFAVITVDRSRKVICVTVKFFRAVKEHVRSCSKYQSIIRSRKTFTPGEFDDWYDNKILQLTEEGWQMAADFIDSYNRITRMWFKRRKPEEEK